MDWIQEPFEVDALLHDGPGAPTVRIRWLFTDRPGFPPDPPQIINNRIWTGDDIAPVDVGQFPAYRANYVQDARWKLPAMVWADHICYPEWLATGEPWPNDLPPQEYWPNGMPKCCGVPLDQPAGGVEVGGVVGDTFGVFDAAAGGVEVGGEVGDLWGYFDAAAGGVEVGGEVGDALLYFDAAAGGVEVGGAAGDLFGYFDAAAGGAEVGGAAGDTFIPSGPTPGHVCASAGVWAPGQTYHGGVTISSDDWFVTAGSSGLSRTVTFTNDPGSNAWVIVSRGTSCGTLTDQSFLFANGSVTKTPAAGEELYVQILYLFGPSPAGYTVALS